MGCTMYISDERLDGKTAVVTGSNTGIGKETVLDFVQRGCRVIMACRDVSKAEAAATEIREKTSGVAGVGTVVVVRLDLSSLASVRQCAAELLRTEPQINLLINNAGNGGCLKALSEDGIEMLFAVNHLGHFLLTLLLLPKMLISTPARIINVASNKHKGTGVTVYAVRPALVATHIFRHLDEIMFPGATWFYDHVISWFIKTPVQGAQTTIYCAVAESVQKESGLYYSDCKLAETSRLAKDPELALQLWEVSINMVGGKSCDISRQ